MDIGSILGQLRGMAGSLPTMQFGGAPAPAAAPAVPADGAMPPTIGPGVTPPVAPLAHPATLKMGLPTGGLLAMMQGKTNPQGLVGLLQQLSAQQPGPMNGTPPGTGMLDLPKIKPMDMF
jgi:hypothetical protein